MNQRLHAVFLSSAIAVSAAAQAEVPYPDGYRDWHHVKSMVINPGHSLYDAFGGIHHLYANDLAQKGYDSGTFPDGSVIVFDLLEAEHTDDAVHEGDRKVLGVMYKDSELYKETGGWGFEGFGGGDPGNPVVGDNAVSACYTCHTSQAGNDYVFSQPRD